MKPNSFSYTPTNAAPNPVSLEINLWVSLSVFGSRRAGGFSCLGRERSEISSEVRDFDLTTRKRVVGKQKPPARRVPVLVRIFFFFGIEIHILRSKIA